jgi:23S rRNA (pseudouridine1915-N3)-methyltransferase
MRIRILWEGKTKDPNLRAVQADMAARISHFTGLQVEEISPLRRAGGSRKKSTLSTPEQTLLKKLHGSTKILLDERGRELTSEGFAEWLGQEALRGTRELAFLVGGPDGFSTAFRREADLLLALSRMTLTRDWARTLLLEQIYRGFTILRGYPYPR